MERDEREGVELQRAAQEAHDADLQGEGEKRQIAGESRRAWATEDETPDEPPAVDRGDDAPAGERDEGAAGER